MILKKFIKKLKKIAKENGTSAQVIMADGILVVSPVYFKNYRNKKVVIITDQY